MISWTNPRSVDLTRPYLYLIVVRSPTREHRYVGKASSPSRMNAYSRNVDRVLAGKTKRPAVTRDGRVQSEGNRKYRYVHLVLATAVKQGWEVEHYPIENCDKASHTSLESRRKLELCCDMNDGPSWFVEDFRALGTTTHWLMPNYSLKRTAASRYGIN